MRASAAPVRARRAAEYEWRRHRAQAGSGGNQIIERTSDERCQQNTECNSGQEKRYHDYTADHLHLNRCPINVDCCNAQRH